MRALLSMAACTLRGAPDLASSKKSAVCANADVCVRVMIYARNSGLFMTVLP